MINWIEINSISQLCLVGVTAWYLFETRKQRKNSDKQLNLLKQQNELQNAMSIIPIIKPLEPTFRTSLIKNNIFHILLPKVLSL